MKRAFPLSLAAAALLAALAGCGQTPPASPAGASSGGPESSWSQDGGAIVGADYEVDEEHLAALPENPISLEQAAALVQEKVPGSSASDVRLWEEGDDGRTRYEGDLLYGGIKYEFEIDPRTGRIFDWNADLRD